MSKLEDMSVASHMPFVSAVCSALGVKQALEHGTGSYSTPLLASLVDRVIAIDNSSAWINRMKQMLPTIDIRLRNVPYDTSLRLANFTPAHTKALVEYYEKVAEELDQAAPKVLFVDGYPSERMLVFNAIHRHFDYVLAHDTELPRTSTPIDRYEDLVTDYYRYDYTCGPYLGFGMAGTSLFTRQAMSGAERQRISDALTLTVTQFCAQFEVDPTQYPYAWGNSLRRCGA